jgi:hypothetical protein
MDLLSLVFSWQFLFMSLAVAALIYAIRLLVENIWKTISENKIWRDAILPIMPIVLGGFIGLMAKQFPFPFPEGLTSASARIIFGIVAGLLSAQVYKIIKAMIDKKVNE